MADRAGGDPHIGLVLRLRGFRKGLPVAPVHIFQKALKGHIIDPFPPLPFIMDLYLLPLGAVDQDIVDILRIILKWGVQAKMVFPGQGIQDRPGKAPLIRAGLPAHHHDRPLGDT